MGIFSIFNKKDNSLKFVAPLKGKVLDLEKVEDQVFSQKMMGDGFAIFPDAGVVVAPCDCEVVSLFPTNHAIGLKSKTGEEILIHLGLDTVNLKGEGFKPFVKVGDSVVSGQKLLEFDLESIKTKVPSIVTPIIFTSGQKVEILKVDTEVQLEEENIIKIIKE